MLGQLEKIKFPLPSYSFGESNLDYISGLRKINLFVGGNNSGKSRLLRSILTTQFEYDRRALSISEIKPHLEPFIQELRNFAQRLQGHESSIINLANSLAKLGDATFASLANDYYTDVKNARTEINHAFQNNASGYNRQDPRLNGIQIKDSVDEILARASQLPNGFKLPDYFANVKFRRIYIPVIRGLRRFSDNDIVFDRIKEEYFKDNSEIEIFTGYDFYSTVRRLLLGSPKERSLIHEYEQFLSTYFFNGNEVSLIPHESENVFQIKIGREKQRSIQELGDGLQSLIVMTYPIFLYQQQDGIVLIEEPELYLHPAALRSFAKAIIECEQFLHYQFFFATHSNHLLDLSLDYDDTASFSVHKNLPENGGDEVDSTFRVNPEDHGSERSLAYLGVRNSSVFLTNCTIWVEGVTDRWYLRKFLSLNTDNKFVEDLHYSIVEYGGTNVTHWSWLEKEDHPINVDRLCGRVFLIADLDDTNDGRDTEKARRHQALEHKLNDRFYVLPVREIENLLKPETIVMALKALNLEIDESRLAEFTMTTYKERRLGAVLDELLPRLDGIKLGSETGILKDKVDFCKAAVEAIKNWDDVSEEAKLLSNNVLNHVKAHNLQV